MFCQKVIPVAESSQVGQARRVASTLAEQAGLGETERGKVAIVTTELGNNLLRHAGGGHLLLRAFDTVAGGRTAEVLAVDSGPGMTDVERCLEDGFSTAGTPGNGLGAVRRLSSEFDIYSRQAGGTVILSRVGPESRQPGVVVHAFQWGGLLVPAPGEEVCGDTWRFGLDGERAAVMVADGLGHGPLAAEASAAAGRAFEENPGAEPKSLIEAAHRAVSGTRGAAVAVAKLDASAGVLRYAGIGNISGTLLSPATGSRGLFSHNGTVGGQVRKVQEFEYPWPDAGLLVMHSDGIQTRWALDRYPGLLGRHPAVIAAVLYRDFKRGRDDATVVVLRCTARKPPQAVNEA